MGSDGFRVEVVLVKDHLSHNNLWFYIFNGLIGLHRLIVFNVNSFFIISFFIVFIVFYWVQVVLLFQLLLANIRHNSWWNHRLLYRWLLTESQSCRSLFGFGSDWKDSHNWLKRILALKHFWLLVWFISPLERKRLITFMHTNSFQSSIMMLLTVSEASRIS